MPKNNAYEKLEKLLTEWELSHCCPFETGKHEYLTLKELLIKCRTEATDGAEYHKEGGEKERILNKCIRRWETLSEPTREHVIESLKQQESRYKKYLSCENKINAYLKLIKNEEFMRKALYNPKTQLGLDRLRTIACK